MSVTTNALTRVAAVAAVAAGALFIGVQLNHPHLDVSSIATPEVIIRNLLKTLMAVLALIGITGMYLSQVRRNGILGLVGYVILSGAYLLITATTTIAAFVMPALAAAVPGYVADVIAVATGRTPTGDIGSLQLLWQTQDIAYLVGGLIFGIALFRARVLARWTTALLALGGLISIALSLMPDAFYRLLAFPNGIAMIGLGLSLWASTRRVSVEVAAAITTAGEDPVQSVVVR